MFSFGVTIGGVAVAPVGPDPEMGGGPDSGLFMEPFGGGTSGRCGAGSFAPGGGGI